MNFTIPEEEKSTETYIETFDNYINRNINDLQNSGYPCTYFKLIKYK